MTGSLLACHVGLGLTWWDGASVLKNVNPGLVPGFFCGMGPHFSGETVGLVQSNQVFGLKRPFSPRRRASAGFL
ncbi:hypothetical protein [Agrobacterium cavarae]|uniref:hypothetical protein n=1 Tax=Agrobacterium cavarae TaxID=2528239 RepID=UPI0028A9B498|nr:hypothetical protein [Agrobacterium cavarae]